MDVLISDNKHKKSKSDVDDNTSSLIPSKDRKFHEFQFYSDLTRLKDLDIMIKDMYKKFQEVPQEILAEYESLISSGF